APKVSSKNIYIEAVKRNGSPEIVAGVSYDDMMQGGTLEFEMTDHPVLPPKEVFELVPGSTIPIDTTAVPIIGDGRRTFQKSMTFSMQTVTPNSKIYYTLDTT